MPYQRNYRERAKKHGWTGKANLNQKQQNRNEKLTSQLWIPKKMLSISRQMSPAYHRVNKNKDLMCDGSITNTDTFLKALHPAPQHCQETVTQT